LADDGLFRAVNLESERNVVKHVQMRKQRVLLKHCVDLAKVRRGIGNVHAVHLDSPFIRHDKTGDEAKHGRFATAGRTEQR